MNSGNGGGGMFNTAGQLVGIPTLKYIGNRYSSNATVESIGMCIPINEAKDVISEALKADKQAVGATEEKKEESGEETGGDLKGKPRMGVSVQTVRDTKGMLPRGVYVAEVEKNSPAEAAGVQVGDIMVEINGQVITSVEEEIEILGKLKEGDEVKLKVFRPETVNETGGVSSEGDYVDLTVKLAIVDAVAQ
jgi:serine protease Do